MSAAIQLVTPQQEQAERQLEVVGIGSPEVRLRRTLDYVEQLQAEVRTLREELARAERLLGHKDLLLRNATLREQELRAELVKGMR
jgi:hypothetical protein